MFFFSFLVFIPVWSFITGLSVWTQIATGWRRAQGVRTRLNLRVHKYLPGISLCFWLKVVEEKDEERNWFPRFFLLSLLSSSPQPTVLEHRLLLTVLHGVESLHHAVGRQPCLRVVIPALSDGGAEDTHPLRTQQKLLSKRGSQWAPQTAAETDFLLYNSRGF